MCYSRLTGGSFAATYESCSTAIYRQGRTETVRPLTREAAEVAEAFNSPGNMTLCCPKNEVEGSVSAVLVHATFDDIFWTAKYCNRNYIKWASLSQK